MLLYIVRHAWAMEREEWDGPSDESRPLTEEGRRRFTREVEVLDERGMSPAVIATSPLVRTRQTADLLARGLSEHPIVVELPAMAPGSDLDVLLKWTADQTVEELAWVGHAPDVELLTSALISDGSASFRFAKGAVAAIQFDGKPARGRGQLQWLATAKMLGVVR